MSSEESASGHNKAQVFPGTCLTIKNSQFKLHNTIFWLTIQFWLQYSGFSSSYFWIDKWATVATLGFFQTHWSEWKSANSSLLFVSWDFKGASIYILKHVIFFFQSHVPAPCHPSFSLVWHQFLSCPFQTETWKTGILYFILFFYPGAVFSVFIASRQMVIFGFLSVLMNIDRSDKNICFV